MTLQEKLEWLRANTLVLTLEYNAHKAFYRTLEQELTERDELHEGTGNRVDLEPEVRAECLRRDQLWEVFCHPATPVVSYMVLHYDLGAAIDRAYEAVRDYHHPPRAITPSDQGDIE